MRAELETRFAQATDVYSTAGFLNPHASAGKISTLTAKKLAEFLLVTQTDFSQRKWTPEKIAEKLNQWVRSPDEALYAYQNLESFGGGAEIVFASLLRHNVHFRNALPVRGPPRSVQTFSFEKETNKGAKAYRSLWRPRDLTDEAWLQKSDAEQLSALAISSQLVPTIFGSARYGRLTDEAGGDVKEFRHPSYEIDLAQVQKSVHTIARDLKESHSFHIHQSFDLPRHGARVPHFKMWFKTRGDRMHLLALESGLHSSPYTLLGGVPENNSRLNEDKFHTLGFRVGIYGSSKDLNYVRVGLETRDAVRDLGLLFKEVRANAADISNEVWSQATAPDPSAITAKGLFALVRTSGDPLNEKLALAPEHAKVLTDAGLGEEFIQRIAQLYVDLPIPLAKFESGVFYDYAKGEMYRPTQEQALRLREARSQFLSELKKLETEVQTRKDSGFGDETAELEMAVKWIVHGWAKAARPSELYRR